MSSTVRSILAVAAGFVVACVVMMIVESINGKVLYPELGKMAEGVTDRETIRKIFASAPVGSLLVVLCGWALGSLLGGAVATWMGRQPLYRHALIVGVLVTLGAIANNLMLPPPLWFWVVGVILPIPAAAAGGRLAPGSAV
jgi:ABC-type nitrate/sulfonate/bicarbonate transport system permease component